MNEEKYSEEEVYTLIEQAIKDCYLDQLESHTDGDYENLKRWFNQEKKQNEQNRNVK